MAIRTKLVRDAVTPEFMEFAKTILPERPVICDIGSRDALEGIYLFQQLGGNCLHVFEPNPIAADICRKNLEQVSDGGVYCNEVAISDEIGELQFYPVNPTLSDNKDIGFSSLFRINPDYTKRRGRIIQDKVIVIATTWMNILLANSSRIFFGLTLRVPS